MTRHTESTPLNPAALAPVVTVKRHPGSWSVHWDEPETDDPAMWREYMKAAHATMLPAMDANWPAWQATRATTRHVAMNRSSFGHIRNAPESVAREVVAVIRRVFPAVVVSGPRAVATWN